MKPVDFPINREYVFLEETDSTNTYLKQSIKVSPAPLYQTVCANRQTAGRGRLQRSFFSPQGGLYGSVSFPLTGKEKNIPFLTLLSGVAVANALDKACRTHTQIKWPNDIYINGKKLCGILTESVSSQSGFTAVVGIGINLTLPKKDIPPELQNKITSLQAESLPIPERKALITEVANQIDTWVYRDNALNAPPENVVTLLNQKSFLYNKQVSFAFQNTPCTGTAKEIAPNGALTVQLPNGESVLVQYGEVLQYPTP